MRERARPRAAPAFCRCLPLLAHQLRTPMRTRLHLALLLLPLAVAAQGITAPSAPRRPRPHRDLAVCGGIATMPSCRASTATGRWRRSRVTSRQSTPTRMPNRHRCLLTRCSRAADSATRRTSRASAISRCSRAATGPQRPADSLYRAGREHLNRGDYRWAATSSATSASASPPRSMLATCPTGMPSRSTASVARRSCRKPSGFSSGGGPRPRRRPRPRRWRRAPLRHR